MRLIQLQKRSSILETLSLLLAAALLGTLPTRAQAGEANFEVPGEMRAADVLPEEMLRGTHHQLMDRVVTYNGFTRHFELGSKFGTFKATGNGMVPVRIAEINAIASLAKMRGSKEFVNGLKKSAGSLLTSTKNLVLHPVDTVSGFPSGLYKV